MNTCHVCGKGIAQPDSFGTGYGTDSAGNKVCYACCAEQDKAWMLEHDRITLYLTDIRRHREVRGFHNGEYSGNVTNWPGTLRYENRNVKVGRHNIAGVRYDVWFVGPDKHVWHGITYGDNTQLCHCKRTQETA